MNGVKVAGSVNIYLEDDGNVAIDMEPFGNKNLGRLVLTPEQARSLSLNLLTMADEADSRQASK